jgi:hypothetical protein
VFGLKKNQPLTLAFLPHVSCNGMCVSDLYSAISQVFFFSLVSLREGNGLKKSNVKERKKKMVDMAQ